MVSDQIPAYPKLDVTSSTYKLPTRRCFTGRWEDVYAIKEQLKKHPIDNVDNDVFNALNAIEQRDAMYPMLSIKEAAVLLSGMSKGVNHSRIVSQARDKQEIFAFRFSLNDSSKVNEKLKIPAFQFDAEHSGVFTCIPAMVRGLQGLSDHAVFNWLTTPLKKYKKSPAQLVSEPAVADELVDRARFYKAEHQKTENRLA